MSDRLSQKLAGSMVGGIEAQQDPDASDDLGSFGLLRGMRERSQMLTLKRSGGNQVAISYAMIERIEFNPSEQCITLHGVGREVRIRGKNLSASMSAGVSMFDALARHRVPWICEVGQAGQLRTDDAVCIVTAIDW